MMKIRKIKVLIQSHEDFRKKMLEDIRKIDRGTMKTLGEESITFHSMEQFRKIMTNKRIELLKAVRHKKPESVYRLAKIVGRSVDNVNADVRLLEQMGFLETKKSEKGRKHVVPRVDFSSIQIEVPI